jgi:hypothetical protein
MAQGWKSLIKLFKYCQKHIRFQSNSIAIAKKNFFHIAIGIFGHGDVFRNFGKTSLSVLFVFVHAAESALIMGTADSTLQKITVGFAKRPEYVAFVSHFFTFSHKKQPSDLL